MKQYRNTYLISDLHLGHKNILKLANRPWSNIDDMNNDLVKNWNSVVKDEYDLVYLLGDVALGMKKDKLTSTLNDLNGTIVLIMGNHDWDYKFRYFKDTNRFLYISPHPIIIEDFIMLSHKPLYVGESSPYFNIYGHVHDDDRYKTISSHSACVCVERWDYKPVNIEFIRNLSSKLSNEIK